MQANHKGSNSERFRLELKKRKKGLREEKLMKEQTGQEGKFPPSQCNYYLAQVGNKAAGFLD